MNAYADTHQLLTHDIYTIMDQKSNVKSSYLTHEMHLSEWTMHAVSVPNYCACKQDVQFHTI